MKKKGSRFAYSSLIILSFFLLAVSPALAFSGSGAGTVGDPFVITTPAQLDEMHDNLTAAYVLGNDIDMAGYNWNASGPIGDWAVSGFSGYFDGQNYSIDNLHWQWFDSAYSYPPGFFGVLTMPTGGWIKNVFFDNYSLISLNYDYETTCCGGGFIGADDSYGNPWELSNVHMTNSYVDLRSSSRDGGGMVGYFSGDNGRMYNISFEGTVIGGSGGFGGLVGYVTGNEILEYGSFNGTLYYSGVHENASAVIGATPRIGGLVGQVYGNATIRNSYSNAQFIPLDDSRFTTCDVNTATGYCWLGGFVGALSNSAPDTNRIEESYFYGSMPDNGTNFTIVRPDVGYSPTGTISCSNVYYRSAAATFDTAHCSSGLTGLSDDDFDNESAFVGFNFTTVWVIQALSTPIFQWQVPVSGTETITFTAFDEYNSASINTFCVYDVTNVSEQWCTTNGTTSGVQFSPGNYTFKINATGYYETQQNEEITASGNINMTTKGLVVVSNVLVDGQANPSAVWNETTSQVNVSWIHNGVDTATEVDYGTGSTVVYNVSSVLINTNSLAVGENTFAVTMNESYSGLQSQSTDTSNPLNVSKLGTPSNIAPNSGQVTQTLFNATWNAATNGLGSVTYDSIIQINGTNYSIDTATPNLYSTVNTTFEGPSKVYVRANDDYFTTTYVVGGQFEIIFEIGLSSFTCPAELPNEENLPAPAQFDVGFNADLAVGFTTTTIDMTVKRGAESVVIDETDCSYVQNSPTSRTYSCNVSMNYWFAPGAYDVNVTVYDAADQTNQFEASLCTYGSLIASKRTVDTITFPGSAPGTTNVIGTPAMNMQNTGNVDLNLSMTAQDLTGRTNPAAVLLASNFKAGATLGTAVAMADNVQKDLNIQLLRGSGSEEDVWLWLSMPSNQDPQEYFTPDAWEIFATG